MKIHPLQDNVLLKIHKEEKELGFIIPDSAYDDEVAVLGEVLEKGVDVPDTLKVGDLVTFKKHLFDEIMLPNKEVYLLGKVEHITAKIEK